MLSPTQLYFIAASLLHPNDDKAAAEASNVDIATVDVWKLDPEFMTALDQAYGDNIEFAKSQAKNLIGKAVTRLDELLDAAKKGKFGAEPDHVARAKAIELVMRANGLLNDKNQVGVAFDNRQIILDLGIAQDEPEIA
jgi:hypothetical protein